MLAAGAGDERGDDVCGVAVEGLAAAVVAHGGSGIGVAGCCPYFTPLRELLVRAFGVPARLRAALAGIDGVDEVYIFGSWAARWHGEHGTRPVGDIGVLMLGHPDRDRVYAAAHELAVRG